MSTHGLYTEYFRTHRGRELTNEEFDQSLGLTPAQRRLVSELLAEAHAALKKVTVRAGNAAARKAGRRNHRRAG